MNCEAVILRIPAVSFDALFEFRVPDLRLRTGDGIRSGRKVRQPESEVGMP